MHHTPVVYRLLSWFADRALPAAAGLSAKLATGDRERRAAVGRWAEWGRSTRDPHRPLLWCHAPSVGEGLQAEAVLRILRQRHPDWQLAYTFFSPSAVGLAGRLPVDGADYLPYDTPANAERMLAALRPTALVFTKLDLWPELAVRAARGGVAVGLVAATVAPVSGRLRWPARALTRSGYAAITAAGAIADDDAHRLRTLGVPADRIEVTGDPRFDSALERAGAVPADDALRRLPQGAPTLVAGSTWDADEQVLFRAFRQVRRTHPSARLIVVPHEPTREHLRRSTTRIRAAGLPDPVLLSGVTEAVPLLLVDRVGVLATLYCTGEIAYVGGGFGRRGLHSVLEPAAAGLPVVFGPRWQSSREAGLLLAAGAAVELPPAAGGAAERLASVWDEWIRSAEARSRAGAAARRVVDAGVGAARRNAELVERLMGLSDPRRSPRT